MPSEQTDDDSNVTGSAAELTTELTDGSAAGSTAGSTAETSEISEDSARNVVWGADPDIERPYVLRLFETTDVHGYLADISANSMEKTYYRMAWISQKVDDARERYGDDNVILLDTGDVYEGNIMSNAVEGQCMIAAADLMHYDVYGIGNHEFNWGLDIMNDSDATLRAYDIE